MGIRHRVLKDAWYLASSRTDLTGAKIKDLYGRRFTIEENLRDTKNLHFGLGLSATHISVPARRDRLLLLVALAEALLTLLGAAAESLALLSPPRHQSRHETPSFPAFRRGATLVERSPGAHRSSSNSFAAFA